MKRVTKKEIVACVSKEISLSKKVANQYFSAFLQEITNQLAQGNSIDITGFGKFVVKERCERKGINPATKESIIIPASKTVKFTPKQGLKSAVNFQEEPEKSES